METQTINSRLESLNKLISKKWEEILTQPEALNFSSSIMGKDRRVYALYLTQVYHYTYHTARNQALVGVNAANTDIKYMQFCFEHALEETGHELMAVHDLKSIGVSINDPITDMPPIMPSTELLVAYLYWVSQSSSPIQRLGYSYWAERSYDLIRPFVETLTSDMELDKKQMTFYYNHALIDDKHADDVERILLHACKTEDDWQKVMKTAEMTIDLTHGILKDVLTEYEKLVNGEPSDFEILNGLR